MSQDKNVCSVKLNEGMFGYLGNQPVLRQGKKGPFTQFSLYNKYLPVGLNPIKVSVFGELAQKVCSDLKDKDAVRVMFDKMAFGEVVNTKTGAARPGIFIIMKDYQLSAMPTQPEVSSENILSTEVSTPVTAEVNADDEEVLKAAIALLTKNGIKVAS